MPGTSFDHRAMTETEILRRHVLYQTSYTGHISTPVSVRSMSPLKRETIRKPKLVKKEARVSQDTLRTSMTSPSRGRSNSRSGVSPSRRSISGKKAKVVKSDFDVLDDRRLIRAERRRPWNESVPKSKKKQLISALYYDKVLPSDVDKNDIIMRPRRYVSNSKYGDIYELRQEVPKKQEKAPPVRKWLWEDEFLLWKGSREKYLEEVGTKTKTFTSATSAVSTLTPRTSNMPSIKEHSNRPSAQLYADRRLFKTCMHRVNGSPTKRLTNQIPPHINQMSGAAGESVDQRRSIRPPCCLQETVDNRASV